MLEFYCSRCLDKLLVATTTIFTGRIHRHSYSIRQMNAYVDFLLHRNIAIQTMVSQPPLIILRMREI
jgi:hypothetical protein